MICRAPLLPYGEHAAPIDRLLLTNRVQSVAKAIRLRTPKPHPAIHIGSGARFFVRYLARIVVKTRGT